MSFWEGRQGVAKGRRFRSFFLQITTTDTPRLAPLEALIGGPCPPTRSTDFLGISCFSAFRWIWPRVSQGCFLVETSGGNAKSKSTSRGGPLASFLPPLPLFKIFPFFRLHLSLISCCWNWFNYFTAHDTFSHSFPVYSSDFLVCNTGKLFKP